MALPLAKKIVIAAFIAIILAAISLIWGIKTLIYIMIVALLIPNIIKSPVDDLDKGKRQKASGIFVFLSHWIFEILQSHSTTLGIVKPDSLEAIYITGKCSIKVYQDKILFNYMAYKLPSTSVTEKRIKEILNLELLRKYKIAKSREKNTKIINFRVEKVTFFESYIVFTISCELQP